MTSWQLCWGRNSHECESKCRLGLGPCIAHFSRRLHAGSVPVLVGSGPMHSRVRCLRFPSSVIGQSAVNGDLGGLTYRPTLEDASHDSDVMGTETQTKSK